MNFLAHCLLAGPGDGFLAGAVLGDFVKGRIPDAMPPDLQAGVRLHRRIDAFCNRLPACKRSARRFHPALRRPAPVLLDLVADHCLALDWGRYAGGDADTADLGAFAATVYAALGRLRAWVPAQGQRFIDYMARADLLASYIDPAVVHRAMTHVLKRLRHDDRAHLLTPVLAEELAGFRADFAGYFPCVAAFAAAERDYSTTLIGSPGRGSPLG